MPSSSAPPRQHSNGPRQHVRINLGEIKSRISKRLGPDRSNQYFTFLNRFFSNKISKQELNKQCLLLFRHENIQLHNQLIRSILKNSLLSKTPPPQNSHERPPIKSNLPNSWCNGGILPISPRKIRTAGTRERRMKDPIAPPNGLLGLDANPNQATINNSIKENGTINPQGAVVHNLEEPEDQATNISHKRPFIEPPLGIPFCRPSIGGAQFQPYTGTSTSAGTSSGTITFSSRGELFNTLSLKNRMENIVKAQGLEGVSSDCAEIINRSLDLYLKRVIGSVTSLTGSRNSNSITLEDFTVAMQINPQILGENYPEQMERMNLRLFEQKDEKDKMRE